MLDGSATILKGGWHHLIRKHQSTVGWSHRYLKPPSSMISDGAWRAWTSDCPRRTLRNRPPKGQVVPPVSASNVIPVLVCHGNVEMSPPSDPKVPTWVWYYHAAMVPCSRSKNKPVKSLLDSPSSGFAGEKKDTQKCPKNHEANPYHKVSVRDSAHQRWRIEAEENSPLNMYIYTIYRQYHID